jgi:hypothetical protein
MDNPINNPYFLQFSSTTNCTVNTIPNFSFYTWTDAKSTDFYETKNDILNNKKLWEEKEDIIMWSGINSSTIREKLHNYIQQNKDTTYVYNLIYNYKSNHTYIELKDHSKISTFVLSFIFFERPNEILYKDRLSLLKIFNFISITNICL